MIILTTTNYKLLYLGSCQNTGTSSSSRKSGVQSFRSSDGFSCYFHADVPTREIEPPPPTRLWIFVLRPARWLQKKCAFLLILPNFRDEKCHWSSHRWAFPPLSPRFDHSDPFEPRLACSGSFKVFNCTREPASSSTGLTRSSKATSDIQKTIHSNSWVNQLSSYKQRCELALYRFVVFGVWFLMSRVIRCFF